MDWNINYFNYMKEKQYSFKLNMLVSTAKSIFYRIFVKRI